MAIEKYNKAALKMVFAAYLIASDLSFKKKEAIKTAKSEQGLLLCWYFITAAQQFTNAQ